MKSHVWLQAVVVPGDVDQELRLENADIYDIRFRLTPATLEGPRRRTRSCSNLEV